MTTPTRNYIPLSNSEVWLILELLRKQRKFYEQEANDAIRFRNTEAHAKLRGKAESILSIINHIEIHNN